MQRKHAKQQRSTTSVLAIVAATDELLKTYSAQKLTTNHIAERAGVSIGTLYQYFPDKQAIYARVIQQKLDHDLIEFRATIEAQHPTWQALANALVTLMFEQAARTISAYRQILLMVDPLLMRQRVETSMAAAERVLCQRISQFIHTPDSQAMKIAVSQVRVMLQTQVNYAVQQQPEWLTDPSYRDWLLASAIRRIEQVVIVKEG